LVYGQRQDGEAATYKKKTHNYKKESWWGRKEWKKGNKGRGEYQGFSKARKEKGGESRPRMTEAWRQCGRKMVTRNIV